MQNDIIVGTVWNALLEASKVAVWRVGESGLEVTFFLYG